MELQLIQIQSKIYHIRGQKVMLDRDLAALYGVTKNLNLSVKRNIKRFPIDFMFQLTEDEWNNLRFQFATSKCGGRRYYPYAFTEQGVAMLSGLLNSDIAIEANIAIMRAFVMVRQVLFNQPVGEVKQLQHDVKALQKYIEDIFTDQNDINEDTRMQLELINQALAELQTYKRVPEKPRRRIGFIQYDEEESKNVNNRLTI